MVTLSIRMFFSLALSSSGNYCKDMGKIFSAVSESSSKNSFVGANLHEKIEVKSGQYIYIGTMQVKVIEEAPS